MGVSCSAEDRNLRIDISGEVDHHQAKNIMAAVDREIDLGLPKQLTIDLGGVTFMDSSGIAVLLRAMKRVGETGGSLTVRNVPEQAARMLNAAGVGRILKFE